jgi:ribonucleoside-diphosphate reductase alpha chain
MKFPVQRHLPRRRGGHTTSVIIDGERLHITASQRADGTLGEVFVRWGKQGSSTSGLLDSYTMALSAGLLHHVPLAELLRPGLDLLFTPNGHTDDPEIPRARSVVDYLARRLAIDWLPYPDRAALGVYTLTERVAHAGPWLSTQDPANGVRWELATGIGVATQR